MSPLLFSNGTLLTGLAALAIPILIHLFLKRKSQRMRFSTVQFFRKPDAGSRRWKKVRNWLLFAVRLLLVTTLVLAFARPYLPNTPEGQMQKMRRQIVFVLDRSASMQARDADGLRWAKSVQALHATLSQLDLNDQVALVTCGLTAEVFSPMVPPDQLGVRLNDLMPGYGAGDLGEGLQAAVKLLAAKPRERSASIYILSDFQRSACRRLASFPVPNGIDVQVMAAGGLDTPNLALSDLQYDPLSATPCRATVSNFSEQDAREVKMEFVVDGGLASSPSISVAAGGSTNVVLSLPALSPGWHTTEVRLHPNDRFPLDDVRYQTAYIPQPVRVVAVQSRKATRISEEENFFFCSALNPAAGRTNRSASGFEVEKIAPEALVKRLTAQPRPSFVALPALSQIPYDCGQALLTYVQAGGGLLLFMGEGISVSRYNEEFRDLLPAVLKGAEGDPTHPEDFWRLQEFQKEAEVFTMFRQPNSGDLTLAEFKRRLAAVPATASQVIARFSDGAPLLVARDCGAGRVVMFNTSIDTSWTDWPKHKTYVPMIHGLGRYLAGGSVAQPVNLASQFVAGSRAEVDLGSSMSGHSLQLFSPGGKETKVVPDGRGRLRFEEDRPGVYILRDEAAREVRRWAVNVPQSESDLLANTAAEFHRQLVRGGEGGANGEQVAAAIDGSSNERPLWRFLMMGVLILLLLELVAANRTFA